MQQNLDNLETMRRAWDRMSSNYTDHTDLHPADLHYQELAKQFPMTTSSLRLLDLGSGLGYALDSILVRIPNAIVTCLDLSDQMLKGLRQRLIKYSSQIETRNESYVTANLGENQYDYIISSFTLHHLPKDTKLAVFKKIQLALDAKGFYVELDGVASLDQEANSQKTFKQYVAQRQGADLGEWNFDLLLSISAEKNLMDRAGFSSVTMPWIQTDETGAGRAIFVAEK